MILWLESFKNCANRLVDCAKSFQSNRLEDSDNAAYLACFLDAAISYEDAETEMYESSSVIHRAKVSTSDRQNVIIIIIIIIIIFVFTCAMFEVAPVDNCGRTTLESQHAGHLSLLL